MTLTANQEGSFPKSKKIEINLQDKANLFHHLPAMVKVIPKFGSGNPMGTLLYIFCRYCFQFEAMLLRYMSWFTVWKNSEIFFLVFQP